jgi:hypothetical protein
MICPVLPANDACGDDVADAFCIVEGLESDATHVSAADGGPATVPSIYGRINLYDEIALLRLGAASSCSDGQHCSSRKGGRGGKSE